MLKGNSAFWTNLNPCSRRDCELLPDFLVICLGIREMPDRNSFGHLSDSQANYEEIREEFAVATRAWVEICPECGITFQHLTQNDNTSSPGRQTFIIRQVSSG